MITFKRQQDLTKLPPDHPAYGLIRDLIQVLIEDFPLQPYDAEDYGYLVLVEPGDEDRVLTELDMPWTLSETPWEGASLRGRYIYAVYLGTDDYGLGFVIPDEPWIDGQLRDVLTSILDTTPEGEHA
ncbi:hypothetical protein [Thioalkalivibrio sp. XN8]|uniref:hypothetical protein n=1 Tax=Thioalkalivibrio sp. XN8 TaxID=2712863 RepID=UPI0013EB5279|nr:hypothetical protein [Thioalkalivibrio sp. XN8]NGP53235.1 hypothetical protein [Thioalkalivibrio sp. XN8]